MRAILTVIALWAAGLGAAAQFGKISVLYQFLEGAYPEHSGVGIGFMLSIVGIVGLIFGTTAGLLVAQVGARRAILAALTLGAALSLIQASLPSYPVLLATRVLEGCSHLAIVIVGPVMIAQIATGRHQGLAMTLWSSFFGVAYALLAAFAPMLIAAFGAPSLFVLHAGWMALMAAVLFVLLPAQTNLPATGQGAGILAQHLQIYRSPFLAAPAMGFVCYTVTYVAVLTLLPNAIAQGYGGFVAVAMPLASIAISLSLGVWLLAHLPAFRLVQAGFALAALAALGLWMFWSNGPVSAAFALILASALGIVQGASFAALAQINPAPNDQAKAAGAIAQLGNLGTTTGTPLLALLLSQAGVTGLALFLIGFSLLGIALHQWQAGRRLNG